jgi:hypothetical protein
VVNRRSTEKKISCDAVVEAVTAMIRLNHSPPSMAYVTCLENTGKEAPNILSSEARRVGHRDLMCESAAPQGN